MNVIGKLVESFPFRYCFQNWSWNFPFWLAWIRNNRAQKTMVPVITSVYLGLGFLIAADNVLVICAVHSSRSLRRATNFSLVSLAVADLLVGVIALPLRTAEVLAFEWTRDVTWCRFSLCVSLLSLSASALNLLSVTAERYFAILRPLTFRSSFTCRRTCCALVFVWLSALLVSFLPLLELGKSTRGQRSHQHKICRFADTMSTEYLTFFSVTIILIPTIFMSYTYFRIFGEARKLRKRLQGLQLQDAKEEKAAFLKESKTAKTIGMYTWVKLHVS